MAIDGKWEIEMQSPMGKQLLNFEFKSSGTELAGALTGTDEANPDILEGKISGNDGTWKLKVSKPMPIKLKFTVTLDGDTLEGKVKPGMFPAMPIAGRRI
ncbi:hypothetical protein AB0N05_25450 [Nocardia sp. NPDC051030]|uniref:hypothetical protein n=1 Tax=Nocardia sp. NPDC051030 TaxID=3155162 RepID=UPI0034423057